MNKTNITASDSIMLDKQFKLSDFIPEFSKFRCVRDKKHIGSLNNDNSLFMLPKKGKMYIKPVVPVCYECGSRNVVKYGTYERKLIFLDIGEKICIIQKYKCKKCGHITYTDISSIVKDNANITHSIIEHIEYLYSYFNGSIHKIRNALKNKHNVEISYQSVENIILDSQYENKLEDACYSGYYLFDALWVKKNGVWKYLLALFDLELNTIISRELVDSESVDVVYKFLNETLRNKKQKCIVTDLKKEYRVAIDRLGIKQQFCTFHTKQLINREIRKFIKQK